MTPTMAGIVFFAGFALYSIADIFLLRDSISGNTWSEIIRDWAKVTLIIPWVFGVLCGHWFHFFPEGESADHGNIAILVWLTWLIFIVSSIVTRTTGSTPNWVLYATLQAGIHAGLFLWRV